MSNRRVLLYWIGNPEEGELRPSCSIGSVLRSKTTTTWGIAAIVELRVAMIEIPRFPEMFADDQQTTNCTCTGHLRGSKLNATC
jgi:hypothetical protein